MWFQQRVLPRDLPTARHSVGLSDAESPAANLGHSQRNARGANIAPSPKKRGVRLICRKCLVSGRVQGVFYRATVAGRARELGLSGYAKNLRDGRVEVLVCGVEEGVRELIDFLWIGSSASKVTGVAVEDVPPESVQLRDGFTTG